jgi:ankyrin repeat protein
MTLKNPPKVNEDGSDSITPIQKACRTDDVAELSKCLKEVSPNGPPSDRQLVTSALQHAVHAGKAKVVKYLLENEDAPLDRILPFRVAHAPSTELFQVLLDNGWDINQSVPSRGGGLGQCLLQRVCDNEVLVRWLLDHGAKVEGVYSDPYNHPPLLESAASRGTLSIFKLLRSRGAELGPRTLHRAASSAAGYDDDPDGLRTRMEVVDYLVDEMGIDVNALDTSEQLPNHWGTPLCYVARCRSGTVITRFLLDRGADPTIKDCWGIHDAFQAAEHNGNKVVMELLQEWKAKRVEDQSV